MANKRKIYFIGKGVGKSMRPLINQEDSIFIEKLHHDEVNIGDVVVFFQERKLVSHRIIKKYDNVIVTKGDNSAHPDNPVKYNKVIGKVIRIEGVYGDIYMTSRFTKFVNFYLYMYSMITYILMQLVFKFTTLIFRGRRLLVKLSAQNHK